MTALEDNREALALGQAWRRCEAALPEEAWIDGLMRTGYAGDDPWEATAVGPIPTGIDIIAAQIGPTPTAALEALATTLEAMK